MLVGKCDAEIPHQMGFDAIIEDSAVHDMAVSMIDNGYIPKGTYDLNKSILGGYVTGSGNYMYAFIPGRFAPSATVTVSVQGAQMFLESGSLSQNDLDLTYSTDIDVTSFGIRLCFKFKNTQVISKPLFANIQGSITIA